MENTAAEREAYNAQSLLVRKLAEAQGNTPQKYYRDKLGLSEEEAKYPIPVLVRRDDAWKPWILNQDDEPVESRTDVRPGVVLVYKNEKGDETNYALITEPDLDLIRATGRNSVFAKEITKEQYDQMGEDAMVVYLHPKVKKNEV